MDYSKRNPSSQNLSTRWKCRPDRGLGPDLFRKPSALPATPTVPMTVMWFGVIGVPARALPTGVNRRVMAGRSTFSMAVR